MARTDFNQTLDRAAINVADTVTELQIELGRGLPAPLRRLTQSAASKLASAQQDLFKARNDPWGSAEAGPARPRQLELL